MLPQVKGLIESSLIEWPGRISTVVFLPGCNFHCPYCHSGQLVANAHDLENIPLASVRETLSRRRGWIDGVVVTGGEPTVHAGLAELLEELKGFGTSVRINTNGSRPGVLKEMVDRGLVDSVAMDVKAPLDKRYAVMAGVEADVEALGESIDWLCSGAVEEVEFRTTVVPGWVGEGEIEAIAARLGRNADYVLQPFRPLRCLETTFRDLPAMPVEDLVELAAIAAKHVRSCRVRGMESEAGIS